MNIKTKIMFYFHYMSLAQQYLLKLLSRPSFTDSVEVTHHLLSHQDAARHLVFC